MDARPLSFRRADSVRRVRNLLRADILDAAFPRGRLPSEDELQTEFDASRSTVRDALAQLRSEGLIDRQQGVGTMATASRISSELSELHGIEDPEPNSIWAGKMRTKIIDWREVPANSVVAHNFRTSTRERVLRIDYVAFVDDIGIGGATNFMRFPEADALVPAMLNVDWYRMLALAGLPVGESTFLIEAAVADEHDVELFGIEHGRPMMVMEEVIFAPDGRPFDFAFTRGRADLVTYRSHARRMPA